MRAASKGSIFRVIGPAAFGLLYLLVLADTALCSTTVNTKDRWFLFSGKNKDGKRVEKCLLVNEVLHDDYGEGTSKRADLILEEDGATFYQKGTYPPARWKRMREPTLKYDCAGITFDELWDKDKPENQPGKYAFKIGADRFYKTVVKEFGRELTDHINSSIDSGHLEVRSVPRKGRRFSTASAGDLSATENTFRAAEADGQIRAEVRIRMQPVVYTSSKKKREILEALRNEIIDDSAFLVWKLLSSRKLDRLKGSVKKVEVGLGSFEIDEKGPLPQKIYVEPERSVARKRS